MDIAAVVGLIGACALIVMAMGDPGPFIDTASVLIVFGGSIMATLYRSTLPEFIGFTKVMGKTFGGYPDKPEDLIVQLAELATIARKDGMIALEGQEIKNKFSGQGHFNARRWHRREVDPNVTRARERSNEITPWCWGRVF